MFSLHFWSSLNITREIMKLAMCLNMAGTHWGFFLHSLFTIISCTIRKGCFWGAAWLAGSYFPTRDWNWALAVRVLNPTTDHQEFPGKDCLKVGTRIFLCPMHLLQCQVQRRQTYLLSDWMTVLEQYWEQSLLPLLRLLTRHAISLF